MKTDRPRRQGGISLVLLAVIICLSGLIYLRIHSMQLYRRQNNLIKESIIRKIQTYNSEAIPESGN